MLAERGPPGAAAASPERAPWAALRGALPRAVPAPGLAEKRPLAVPAVGRPAAAPTPEARQGWVAASVPERGAPRRAGWRPGATPSRTASSAARQSREPGPRAQANTSISERLVHSANGWL